MKPKGNMTAEEKRLEEIRRTPVPRDGQVLGICIQRVGGSRMIVKCLDGKTRNCRIPGRLKRRLWIRAADVLLIEPWELGGDKKGDLIYKYSKVQVQFLKNKGYLKKLEEFEEF